MNNCYTVNQVFKKGRSRFLALLASACCIGMAQTAQAQESVTPAPDCPDATIAYSQSTYCGSTGNRMAMVTGTAGGTFSSTSGLTINSSNGAITPATSMAGTYMVHYMIPAAGSCPAVDATTSVTIMQQPKVLPIRNVAVCPGSTVNVETFTSDMPNATFTWTSDNTSIGLSAASGTGNTIAPFTAVNTTDAPQRANIAVYATYTENGVTCTSNPFRFAIMVNPVPRVGTIPNQTFCSGERTSTYMIPGPTSGPSVVYVWTNDNPMIGLAKSGQDSIPSFVAMNATGTTQTATITVTPYYLNGERCAGTPTTFTITVNPSPAGTASFNYPGSPYCPVGAISPVFSGPTGGTFMATPAGLNISPVSGNVNTSQSAPGTYTVYYTYANNGGGCSFVNSTTITINDANVAIRYASANYCNGVVNTLFPTITGTTGGTFSGPAGLAIDPATGAINLANSTGGNYNVSYTVNTPTCGNVLVQTTINIIETPVLAPLPNRTVCAGATIPAVTLSSSNVAGATFTWTNDNTAIGLAASGTGNIPSFVGTNNTNAPISAYIRVTPRLVSNGVTCVGRTIVYRVVINPIPTVTTVNNVSVCQSGGATAPIMFTNTSGSNTGITYMWTNSNTAIGLAASGTGNLPSFTPNVGSATISVMARSNLGCNSAPVTFTYTVNACRTATTNTDATSNTGRTKPSVAPSTDAVSGSDMVASPNPARSQVTVQYKGGNPVTLRVLDVNGNTVKTVRGFTSTNSVNLSGLRPGNYVIQLVDERKNTVVQRNIVKL